MADTVLEIRNIQKSFSGVQVLKDINISFERGECHALCGENGAGKSTLMKILSGVYTRDGGEIILEGERSTPGAFGIGCAGKGHQHYLSGALLNSDASAAENMLLGRLPKKKLGNVDWKRVYETAKKNFEQVNLHIDPKTIARKLTVAQQQLRGNFAGAFGQCEDRHNG